MVCNFCCALILTPLLWHHVALYPINNHDSFFVDWFSWIYMNMAVDIKARATAATRIVPIRVVIVVARADDFVSAPKLTLSPLPCLVEAATGNELGKKLGREVGRLVGLVLGKKLGRELWQTGWIGARKRAGKRAWQTGWIGQKELRSSPGLEVVPEVRGALGNGIGLVLGKLGVPTQLEQRLPEASQFTAQVPLHAPEQSIEVQVSNIYGSTIGCSTAETTAVPLSVERSSELLPSVVVLFVFCSCKLQSTLMGISPNPAAHTVQGHSFMALLTGVTCAIQAQLVARR
jgi:tetrahydromethanopterin S-methyltransferase subunit G